MKAPAVMTNDYDQIEKKSEDQIAKEFEEQTANRFADKTARDDVWRRVLEDVKRIKVNENLPKMLEGNKNLASTVH